MNDDRLIDADVWKIIKQLELAGHKAYLVGGCLRDAILRRPVHDFDITTSAKPDEVMALFPKHVPLGLKYGTVRVKEGKSWAEVTTFRSDGDYSDARRPAIVRFTGDLQTDLSRRDFTMNAIALSVDGSWIDPYGGRQDIEDRVIRTVGEAEQRFHEDALRIMRAVRFAAQLGFRIEPHSWKAIAKLRDRLALISKERIQAELDKMMQSPHAAYGFYLLHAAGLGEQLGLVDTVIRRLYHSKQPEYKAFKRISRIADIDARWAGFFDLSVWNAERSGRWLANNRFPRKRIQSITTLLTILPEIYVSLDGPAEWKKLFLEFSYDAVTKAAELAFIIKGRGFAERRKRLRDLRRIYQSMAVSQMNDLAVTGEDLIIEIGLKPGPWIRESLGHLLCSVALDNIPNERNALIIETKRRMKELDNEK